MGRREPTLIAHHGVFVLGVAGRASAFNAEGRDLEPCRFPYVGGQARMGAGTKKALGQAIMLAYVAFVIIYLEASARARRRTRVRVRAREKLVTHSI